MNEDDTFNALSRSSFEETYIAIYYNNEVDDGYILKAHGWTYADWVTKINNTSILILDQIINNDRR